MDSKGGPERAGSLVVELAARTVIVDGTRVELPPMEFSLLAVLAARPGEVITHKELLDAAFGDSAFMDSQDLHWRIWNIRQLIGDADKTVIRNRRGVGFQLEARRVEVLEGVAPTPVAPAHVIRLEAEEPPTTEIPVPARELADTREKAERRPFLVLRPIGLVVIALVAALVLGGSWLAGYTLSQRAETPTTGEAPPVASDGSNDEAQKPQRKPADKRREGSKKRKGKAASSAGSPNFATGTTGGVVTGDATSGTEPSAPSGDGQNSQSNEGETKQEPPPPPQPSAQLYHLYNPDSGDHIMTTSSSVANQKQAAGYEANLEGGVFTSQEKGTVAISLDSGSAFVYRDASSAPDSISVTALYKLSSGDDFFYTTSASAANQAQAQGWARATAGYVAS
jgi:DNA-binding winged helix-turn-helix (wHTH) protein